MWSSDDTSLRHQEELNHTTTNLNEMQKWLANFIPPASAAKTIAELKQQGYKMHGREPDEVSCRVVRQFQERSGKVWNTGGSSVTCATGFWVGE